MLLSLLSVPSFFTSYMKCTVHQLSVLSVSLQKTQDPTHTATATHPLPFSLKVFCHIVGAESVSHLRFLPSHHLISSPPHSLPPPLTRGSCCVMRPMFCPFLPMMKRCSQAGAVTSTTITLFACAGTKGLQVQIQFTSTTSLKIKLH